MQICVRFRWRLASLWRILSFSEAIVARCDLVSFRRFCLWNLAWIQARFYTVPRFCQRNLAWIQARFHVSSFSVLHIRQLRGDHCPLAFVQMSPVQGRSRSIVSIQNEQWRRFCTIASCLRRKDLRQFCKQKRSRSNLWRTTPYWYLKASIYDGFDFMSPLELFADFPPKSNNSQNTNNSPISP